MFLPSCSYVFILVVGARGGKKDSKYTECPTLVTLGLRWPDLANKKLQIPVQIFVQVNNEKYFSIRMQYLEHISTKKLLFFIWSSNFIWSPVFFVATIFGTGHALENVSFSIFYSFLLYTQNQIHISVLWSYFPNAFLYWWEKLRERAREN